MALEALALSRNEAFMSYLDRVSEHARRERTYSLEEIRKEHDLSAPIPRKPGRDRICRKRRKP